MKEYNLSLIISLTFIQGLVSSQLLLYYSHMAFLMFLGPTRVIFSPKTLYMLLLLSFHYFHCGVSVIPSLARPTQWCCLLTVTLCHCTHFISSQHNNVLKLYYYLLVCLFIVNHYHPLFKYMACDY